MLEFVQTIIGANILTEAQENIITATAAVLICVTCIYLYEWLSIAIFPKKWQRR